MRAYSSHLEACDSKLRRYTLQVRASNPHLQTGNLKIALIVIEFGMGFAIFLVI